jgi:cellulose synthase/poly-beta-1,6-N-acetylglucosamine synthase-like glycosyltransferase
MAGAPALSFIVLGPEGRDGQYRLSQLAGDLRTLRRRTELLVTSPDPHLLRRALRSASADLVCIWDPDQCSLEAPQIEKFIQNLPTVWEVALRSPANRQPYVPFLVLRKNTAIEVFARLQATASPLLAALLVARAWGYREVALSLDPVAPSGNHVRRLTRWSTRALYKRAADWAQEKDVQAARKATRRRRTTLRVLILAGTAALGWWLVWLVNFTHAASLPLYGLLVLAQLINIFQVVGYWHAVWRLREPSRRKGDIEGDVDVFITTYNEPVEIVESTLAAVVAMNRPHRTYLLDDGRRPEMQQLARRYGAVWLTRPDNRGHKAGNLNEALKRTDGDFFAVFDADHIPDAAFLQRLLPWFRDADIAWVQAPQFYVNQHVSFTAGGAMDQQAIFFGPVCEGMDGLDAVICCGTNFVMRRAAVNEIGGFKEDSVTEDAATGLALHARGWRSRYINERLADGLAPEDLPSFLKQQRRWAQGNLEMLVGGLHTLNRVRPALRVQYAWAASNYLSGVSVLVYIALPCIFLLFGVQTVKLTTSDDFIAHFLPYIFLTVFIFVRSLDGQLRLRSVQVSFGLFPVHLSALASAIVGRRIAFAVTPKVAQGGSAYLLVIPQLAAIALSLVSIPVGLHRVVDASAITNSCWALFNIAMLAGIVRAASGNRVSEPILSRAQEAA